MQHVPGPSTHHPPLSSPPKTNAIPKSAIKFENRQIELQLDLQSLQKKEQELLEALENVNLALSDLGIPSSMIYANDMDDVNTKKFTDSEQRYLHRTRSSAINTKDGNALTFRGEDKCREYLQLLDLNHDSYLGYSEFREMNAFRHPYGLIEDPAYQSSIAWKIMMLNNGYSLDLIYPEEFRSSAHTVATSANNTVASSSGANASVNVGPEPQIDVDGFVKYRQEIERKQPLIPELDYFGLPLLPSYLIEWKKLKAMIDEVMQIRPFVKTITKEELVTLKGFITIDEMLFVTNNLGFNFTKPELTLLMLWRRRKAIVLIQLLRVYSKQNLSQQEYSFEINQKNELLVQYDEREAVIIVDHINKVKIEEFIAWFLACPKFIDFEKLWYRKIMKWKSWFYRGMRKVDSYCRYLFNLAAHINDRTLLRDFQPLNKLSKYLQEIITWKFSIDIGNFELNPLTSERYPGISCSWKLLKLENPDTMLKSYNIPPGSSTVIIFEFLLKSDMPVDKQETLIDLLRSCLMNNLEKELKNNNPNFNGIQLHCLINEIDENFVLRMMISYKKVVSIDRFFETILLEYRLYDLFTVFLGEMKTNINLQNYLHHHLNNFNDTVSIQFSSTIAMRKNLMMAIMKRLILGFSSALTEEQVNQLNNPNDPSVDQRAMTEAEKKSIQATSSNMKGSAKNNKTMKPLSSITSSSSKHKKGRVQVVAKNPLHEQEEELIRFQRWKLIYPFYNVMKETLEGFYNTFRTFQTSIFRYSFKSLSDVRQKLAILWREYPWLSSLVGDDSSSKEGEDKGVFFQLYHLISDAFLYEKGYFYHHYYAFQEEFRYEIGTLFLKLKDFLERRKREDEERRLKALITIVPNADDGLQEDYMKKQLLNTSEKVVDDDDIDNPLDYIEQLESKQRFQDITNLRLLEICKEYIVGINTIDVISGKSKFSVVIQDFDPMDLWPVIHSMTASTASLKEAEIRKQQKGGEKKETMEQIFKRTSISRNKQSRGTTGVPTDAEDKGKNKGNALMAAAAAFGNF